MLRLICPSWSYGLNSTLVKTSEGSIEERRWKQDGLYGNAIRHIVCWLRKAQEVAENEAQKKYIGTLIKYYETGNLRLFNEYCIEWVKEHEAEIDFVGANCDWVWSGYMAICKPDEKRS